jgi:hypothetical protein
MLLVKENYIPAAIPKLQSYNSPLLKRGSYTKHRRNSIVVITTINSINKMIIVKRSFSTTLL